MLVNIDHIVDLTGSTRRTVVKRCINLTRVAGEGRSILYESKDALPLMFGVGLKNSDKVTLESERTRLASAQATKTELEVEVIKENLIPANQVREVVDAMVTNFRAKMLSLPSKAAHAVLPLADHAEAEDVLREYIREALLELSEYDSKQYCTQNDKRISEAGRAPAPPDSESVGGLKEKTIKRSKRGTGPVEH